MKSKSKNLTYPVLKNENFGHTRPIGLSEIKFLSMNLDFRKKLSSFFLILIY